MEAEKILAKQSDKRAAICFLFRRALICLTTSVSGITAH
jgi:hypothetical protein